MKKETLCGALDALESRGRVEIGRDDEGTFIRTRSPTVPIVPEPSGTIGNDSEPVSESFPVPAPREENGEPRS